MVQENIPLYLYNELADDARPSWKAT